MAQADQTVQNDTFPTVRADINNNFAALFSNNSGNTAPSTTVAHMDWIDTSGADPIWKKRNAANNGWITVGTIKTSAIELSAANVLPSQSGNSGKYLTTNGTAASWDAIPTGSNVEVFTSSGTWTKPSDGTMAYVELWGGGGGGGRAGNCGGGGGGAYRWGFIPLASLAATVSVTVGAGGVGRTGTNGPGTNGGSSEFAALFAGGGGYGFDSGTSGGGEGGGWRTSATGGVRGEGYADAEYGGFNLFGRGLDDVIQPSLWVGAAGGEYDSANGGSSVYGGAGGGGRNSATIRPGGTSTYGGNGGDGGGTGTGQAGGVRGGGGGGGSVAGGDGGRGEVRIYVW